MKRYAAVIGTLVARTAVHIGTGVGGDVTDDICRRDTKGRFLIPGTAIGGVLRSLATRIAPRFGGEVCRALMREEEIAKDEEDKPCPCIVCHLFGNVNPSEGDSEEEGGRASRLFVAHAALSLPEGRSPHIRDGVGIERGSRVSARARRAKFDFEVLPAGSKFTLRIELEDTNETDEMLLAAVLSEWQEGRAWLGGRASRGLGAFTLNGLQFVERDFSEQGALMAYLQSDEPWQGATVKTDWLSDRLKRARGRVKKSVHQDDSIARAFATVKFDLAIDGPFLSNDPMASGLSGFDHAPLLDVVSRGGKPILPGSSLRGAIRSQAEKIARTLASLEAATEEEFLTACPACNPVESRKSFPLASCDALLRAAGVEEDIELQANQQCLACTLFGSTRLGSRLIVQDAECTNCTMENSGKVLDFLAIDRFTGGGKEGAKFDAVAALNPVFPVRLHLLNPKGWELGWLMLVLRDLSEGMIPVGFGAAKGFGRCLVTSYSLEYGFIGDEDIEATVDMSRRSKEPVSGVYRTVSWDTRTAAQKAELDKIASAWVDRFISQCKGVSRPAELKLERDSFFSGNLPQLYEKEAYKCLLSP